VIAYDRIEQCAAELRQQFENAQPFSHLVIDDLYEPDALRAAVEHFPALAEMALQYRNSHEHKAQQSDLTGLHPSLRAAFDELNSPRFLRWLEQVTGIDDLLVDPTNLGGGLHQSGEGMYLDVHVDFNRHTKTRWFRRLNVLVYLNEVWSEENGGVLQFWPPSMDAAGVSVVPTFNRMVVFATTSSSFHGYDIIHPPPGETRRSFAAYYYTEAPPAGHEGNHSTRFRRRPGQRRRFIPSGEVRKMRARVKRAIEIIRER
jgi:Rps23 Pro-64 3,4-dihydroxylase Tpa1-like proline 4-hydroxylase